MTKIVINNEVDKKHTPSTVDITTLTNLPTELQDIKQKLGELESAEAPPPDAQTLKSALSGGKITNRREVLWGGAFTSDKVGTSAGSNWADTHVSGIPKEVENQWCYIVVAKVSSNLNGNEIDSSSEAQTISFPLITLKEQNVAGNQNVHSIPFSIMGESDSNATLAVNVTGDTLEIQLNDTDFKLVEFGRIVQVLNFRLPDGSPIELQLSSGISADIVANGIINPFNITDKEFKTNPKLLENLWLSFWRRCKDLFGTTQSRVGINKTSYKNNLRPVTHDTEAVNGDGYSTALYWNINEAVKNFSRVNDDLKNAHLR